jgi:CBS domain containing-hemolysin-like protein
MNFIENPLIVAIELLALLILVALSAFFSGSETALFSLSRARLLGYSEDSNRIHRKIVYLMNSYGRTLIVLILGNMFVNVGISMLNSEILGNLKLNPVLINVLSVLIAIFLLLIFGEVTPKTLALFHAERFSDFAALPIWILRKVLHPFILVVDKCFSVILDLLGRKQAKPLDHREYSSYLEIACATGAFSNSEVHLLEDALSLMDLTVEEIMHGRVDIDTVKTDSNPAEIAEIIQKKHCLFLPISTNGLDNSEKIISAKDFYLLSPQERQDWQNSFCVSEAIFIPENCILTKALATLRKESAQAALVTDEYGGISGLVTLEDIYERMVGDIEDEHEMPDWEVLQAGKNSWYFDGMIPFYLFEDILEVEIPEEFESTNINGLFAEILDRLPEEGDKVSFNGLELIAEKVVNHRVTKLFVSLDRSVMGKSDENGSNQKKITAK